MSRPSRTKLRALPAEPFIRPRDELAIIRGHCGKMAASIKDWLHDQGPGKNKKVIPETGHSPRVVLELSPCLTRSGASSPPELHGLCYVR